MEKVEMNGKNRDKLRIESNEENRRVKNTDEWKNSDEWRK